MDPFETIDAFANAAADVVAEALIKTAFIAGCAGLTVVCIFILATRRTRG